MKGSVIALDKLAGQTAAALIVNGRLHDFLIDQAGAVPIPGTIFRARADRPLKGQAAMMMDLGGGQTGYLREAAGLKPGDQALVQVIGFAEDAKAVPVNAKVLFKGRFAIVTPAAPGLNLSRAIKDEDERARLTLIAENAMKGSGFGLILRSACETADGDLISTDIAAQLDRAKQALAGGNGLVLTGPTSWELGAREWAADDIDMAPGSFERHGVADLLAPFTSPRAVLSGGASAYVEPTRAFVTVDVNTGGDTSPAAGLKANLALTREISRQLLVRGLGGQIVVDFAPMPKKDRAILDSNLRTALRADPVETALVGWTTLGHFELQRKRERWPVDFSVLT